MLTSSGSSPLTVRGFDHGIMYTVMINVFDGDQVNQTVSDQTVNLIITVMDVESGKIISYYIKVRCQDQGK